MKKLFSIAVSSCCVMALMACSGNKAESSVANADSRAVDSAAVDTTVVDSIAAPADTVASAAQTQADDNAVAEKFLRTLYADYVFGNKDFSKIADHFSMAIIKDLKAEYVSEFDGEGYATWLLRSGEQDGPSDVTKVTSITPEADGWYKVSMNDMGHKCSVSYLITVTNGDVMVEAYR